MKKIIKRNLGLIFTSLIIILLWKMSLVIGLDLAYDSISLLELSLESSIKFT